MPETAYVQQVMTIKQQKQKAEDYKLSTTELFVRQMQQQMQTTIYNCTRSNLGF